MTEPAGVKQEAESHPKKAEEEPKTTADRSPLTRARSSGIRRSRRSEDRKRREETSPSRKKEPTKEERVRIETERGGEAHRAKKGDQKEDVRKRGGTRSHQRLITHLISGDITGLGALVNQNIHLPTDRRGAGKGCYLEVIIPGGVSQKIKGKSKGAEGIADKKGDNASQSGERSSETPSRGAEAFEEARKRKEKRESGGGVQEVSEAFGGGSAEALWAGLRTPGTTVKQPLLQVTSRACRPLHKAQSEWHEE